MFAYETEHHELVTRLCSRTRALSSASEDLAALGEGKLPSKQVDLSGDVGGGPLDTVRLYAYYWFGKLTSPNGWGWLSVAFLSAFFFAAAGFGLRRHAFLRHAAVFAGTGSAVFGILLWVILIFFNPYHDVISADTLWITFALMPPPAGLALISAARRSAQPACWRPASGLCRWDCTWRLLPEYSGGSGRRCFFTLSPRYGRWPPGADKKPAVQVGVSTVTSGYFVFD
ncbi:hypothetical protein LJK87_48230 [Paenibacillus sp. P25]|nr:hypothetical protein LJK87_48230 [Paenibacillus sp. P25]